VNLLDRTISFVEALRDAGVPVSTAETVDATRAITAIDLLDRESLRAAFASTVCKRSTYRVAFDSLFDLYFPPKTGDGAAAAMAEADGAPSGQPLSADEQKELTKQMRQELLELLLKGDEDKLRTFAREAVDALGRAEAGPGRQTYFAYRVHRALSPDTLISALLAAMLGDQERGGLAERVARQTIADRLRVLAEAIDTEVRRRLSEDRGVDQVARSTVKPLTDQVDFLRASRSDLIELRRTVYPLARRLATRLTAKRRTGRDGRLDFRRTVRASLGTGGVPLETYHRPYKPHKPELVVLCDVSGSVASFAHFTLMLTHALREQFAKVRAFAFIDTTDEVTRFMRGVELGDMMARIATEADLVAFDGHSDYGHAFERFTQRYPDAITPKTSLIILGDARNNHRATGVSSLRRMTRQARHSYWLNPEPRAFWGSGDSATDQYLPHVDEMVECRNVEQLAAFVGQLLPT
jgi:uncharacterized protein with von Willebrand factor type A (vWA) domain